MHHHLHIVVVCRHVYRHHLDPVKQPAGAFTAVVVMADRQSLQHAQRWRLVLKDILRARLELPACVTQNNVAETWRLCNMCLGMCLSMYVGRVFSVFDKCPV